MRSTLEAIYRDHRQGLFTVALSITRKPDRAEDAIHDAFARLCRAGTSPTGDPVAYAYAAVRNAAIDITRKRQEMSIDAPAGSEGPNPMNPLKHRDARTNISIYNGHDPSLAGSDQAAMANEKEQIIRKAVDELPQPQRDVLIMKLYAGLTFDQIALASNEPLSTVASRYRRALDKLKEQLAPIA
ncbi:MAG: sigma-70 family RNA polymerase sigma factor [Phycisphaeraceae bacterium]